MPAPRFNPLSRLIFCGLGLFGVSILLFGVLFIGSTLATAWTGQKPDEQLLDLATRFALPLTVLSYPASLLWIAYCRTQFDRRSLVSLGLRARRAFPDCARGALVGTLSMALLAAILWLTGLISVGGWSPEALEIGATRAILALAGYALLFFAVGFFEETLFRGYALHNLSQWLGWRGAVAVQALGFAVVHLGNAVNGPAAARLAALSALPQLCLIAVFFALCVRKTGSLWFPIGFHFAWNLCLGCVFSLPVSGIQVFRLFDVSEKGSNWLSGGAFGAEGSFFLIPILLALIYYISRAPDHPQALLDLELLNQPETAAAPVASLPKIEAEEIETEEPARENRFGTKFGTSQGFSADTLRELRELQEEREQQQLQAREAARRDALALLDSPAPVALALEPLQIAPVAAPEIEIETETEIVAANFVAESAGEIPPKIAAPIPENPAVVSAPVVEQSLSEAPLSEAPVKRKPPAPRW